MDRQVCMIKAVAYRAWTETRTDKSLKTEGPKILSNDIFYFRNVIIGGPTIIICVIRREKLLEVIPTCDYATYPIDSDPSLEDLVDRLLVSKNTNLLNRAKMYSN